MTFRKPTHPARILRQRMTPTERHVWSLVRARRLLGLKFRRQHPIGHFIVDFYCAELKLVIEVEGGVHGDQVEYDRTRQTWLEEQGYRVVRIPNDLVSAETLEQVVREATPYQNRQANDIPPTPEVWD